MSLRMEFLSEGNRQAVLELVNSVFRPESKTMFEEGPLVWYPEFFGYSVAFFDGDRAVSFVGAVPSWVSLWESQIPVILVGNVCTLPEYRGKGLASRLLNVALERAYGDGYPLVYISGDHGLYRAAGGVDFLYATIEFETDEATLREISLIVKKTSPYSVRFYEEKDFEKLFSIYMGQGVKFIRLKKRFRHLYDLYGLRDKSRFRTEYVMGVNYPLIFVVEREGEPVAYLTLGFSGEDEVLTGLNLEFAGDLYAVADGFLMALPMYLDVFRAKGYQHSERFTVSFYATAGGYDSDILARKLKEVISRGAKINPVRKVGHRFYVMIVNREILPLYTSGEIFKRRLPEGETDIAGAMERGRIHLPDYGFNFV